MIKIHAEMIAEWKFEFTSLGVLEISKHFLHQKQENTLCFFLSVSLRTNLFNTLISGNKGFLQLVDKSLKKQKREPIEIIKIDGVWKISFEAAMRKKNRNAYK